MYLGVHYPGDVLGGLAVGAALLAVAAAAGPRLEEVARSWDWKALLALGAGVPAALAWAVPGPNVLTAMGALAGLATGFVLEERMVGFQPAEVRRRPWRLGAALAVAVAAYLGLGRLLPAGGAGRFAASAIMGAYAGFVASWLFFRFRTPDTQTGRR